MKIIKLIIIFAGLLASWLMYNSMEKRIEINTKQTIKEVTR